MSDYRNNDRGRDSGKTEPMWRPAYQGGRRRRRYIVKRPVYKQPIIWILAGAAILVFLIAGSVTRWGANDAVQQQIPSLDAGASPTQTVAPGGAALSSATPNPTAQPTPSPEPQATLNEGPLVYDTSGGQSFHFDENCKGMQGATQETMMAAFNRGLKPCEKCVTSAEAVADRPAITVKAITTLPSSLGNVVIQDPQVFDLIDIVPQLGSLSGASALRVSGTTTGSISILYTNQPDVYDIRIRAILTDDSGNIVWDADDEPVSYAQSGLDMPREISLIANISTKEITGMKLTVLVYAKDGFEGIDADIAVLGMYETTITDA